MDHSLVNPCYLILSCMFHMFISLLFHQLLKNKFLVGDQKEIGITSESIHKFVHPTLDESFSLPQKAA